MNSRLSSKYANNKENKYGEDKIMNSRLIKEEVVLNSETMPEGTFKGGEQHDTETLPKGTFRGGD